MIKSILIIRFRRVGDSILGLALCHSLRLSFPEAKIDYVLNSQIAPLFKRHPDIDNVIAFERKEQSGWGYVKRVVEVMRRKRYDVIIDMRATPKTLLFSLLSLRSKYRIARAKSYGRSLINHRVAKPEGEDMVSLNNHFLDPLEGEGTVVRSREFRLYPTDEEREQCKTYMLSKGISFDKPIILVAVTTRIEGKQWDEERMAEILRRMLRATDAQLIFNYAGPVETRQAHGYFERLGRNNRIFIDVEARDLRQLAALTSLCTFFFGNEGGPRHLSQALGVPSFSIYPAGTSINTWLPDRGERYNGISGDEQELTVDAVWAGLSPMLLRYLN